MRNHFRIALAMLVLLCFARPLLARNPRVQVVTHGSTSWDTRIESLINKELRNLGDVDLASDDVEYKIDIFVIEQHGANGVPTGMLSVSATFLSVLSVLNETLAAGSSCLPKVEKDRLISLRKADMHLQSMLFAIPTQELQRLAADIVATFDVGTLQTIRDLRQRRPAA